jgi:hypothetical protein
MGRRHQSLLALMAVLVALTSGCGTNSTRLATPATQGNTVPPDTSPPLSATTLAAACGSVTSSRWPTYNGEDVRFRYPPCWRPVRSHDTSSFTSSLVDLSTQPIADPCKSTVVGASKTTKCGFPITHLQPEGVLVRWTSNTFPGWTLAKVHGRALSIGGRPAREQVSRPGLCHSIGAAETITVNISRRAAGSYYQMMACLATPSLSEAAGRVQSMLTTTVLTRQ